MKDNFLTYRRLVDRFPKARVAVVGDIMADIYIYGKPQRLSREAPVLVVSHEAEELVPGGCANSVLNLARLGATVYPIGAVGDDELGRSLVRILSNGEVDASGLVIDSNRDTTTKTRIMAGDVHTTKQQVIRIDREPSGPVSPATEKRVLDYLNGLEGTVGALLVSDYGHGFITTRILRRINQLAEKMAVTVDSRFRVKKFLRPTMITPNEAEAQQSTRIQIRTDDDVIRAGRHLLSRTKARSVLITRGNRGMMLLEADGTVSDIPICGTSEITDVTGAGDTVISVCTLALASGATPYQAARLSNYAAGVVVMKRGAATLTRQELLDMVRENHGHGHKRSR